MAIPSTPRNCVEMICELHSFVELINVFSRFLILAVVMDTVLFFKKKYCAMETVLKVLAFWCNAA